MTFDSTTTLRTNAINDGKYTTATASSLEYDEHGIAIPGSKDEKALKMDSLE
jgi:hypothetical protein